MLRLAPQRSPTVCAVLSSVCETTVDNSGVYVYYLKGVVSIYFFIDARLGLWVSLEHACTCALTANQAEQCSSAVYPLAGYRSTRGLQSGGDVHKEAVHLLSLQPASITSSGAFKPECNGLSQFREDTGGPSVPVR